MKPTSKQVLIDSYNAGLRKHGSGPRVAQLSPEGQRFRFEKLIEIGDLTGASILDIGCNVGDFYEFVAERIPRITYTGFDIVPALIEAARSKHPTATFECRDILTDLPAQTFDFVFISGIFNNNIPDCDDFLREMTAAAFGLCRTAFGFNFISTHVNFTDAELAYHDPSKVLTHCVERLSPKIILHHHYQRCDVAIFVYR